MNAFHRVFEERRFVVGDEIAEKVSPRFQRLKIRLKEIRVEEQFEKFFLPGVARVRRRGEIFKKDRRRTVGEQIRLRSKTNERQKILHEPLDEVENHLFFLFARLMNDVQQRRRVFAENRQRRETDGEILRVHRLVDRREKRTRLSKPSALIEHRADDRVTVLQEFHRDFLHVLDVAFLDQGDRLFDVQTPNPDHQEIHRGRERLAETFLEHRR